MKHSTRFSTPGNVDKVLLHTCCAPCSGAIVEALLDSGIAPIIYYCNPNIYPYDEYQRRRDEAYRYAATMGVEFVEDRYDHTEWHNTIKGFETEPERRDRCLKCFTMRLTRAAHYASQHGITLLTSTLDSSRWKSHEQIVKAGSEATSYYPNVEFWDYNWRKNGLSERRSQIVKEQNFYNQRYCGCEFSMGHLADSKQILRRAIRERVTKMSIQERLEEASVIATSKSFQSLFQQYKRVLLYWSISSLDEIPTEPLFKAIPKDVEIYLPAVVGREIEIRRYQGEDKMRRGAFGIMEPSGNALTNTDIIDLAIIPGQAFDTNLYRLGRGGGYYDRLLAKLRVYKVGVCYTAQYIYRVPTAPYDIPMDMVLCPTKLKDDRI